MSPKKSSKKNELARFIADNIKELPMVEAAHGIGISKSYLSEILTGKKIPSVEVGNKIADYFNVSRIKIYKMLGWIEDEKTTKEFDSFIELAKKDPDFLELAELYETFTTPEDRRRAILVLKAMLGDQKEK
jgi:transcriptional regulator with XRE-family HTH domain